MQKKLKKSIYYIYIYLEYIYCTPETNTALYINYISIKILKQ